MPSTNSTDISPPDVIRSKRQELRKRTLSRAVAVQDKCPLKCSA